MTAVSRPTSPKRKWSETLINYWVDFVLFFGFIIDYNLHLTGLPIHEWLGIAVGVAVIYHLLLHWRWIVSVTQKIFTNVPQIQRLKYIVNIALFIDMVIVIATGLFISEVAMGQLGLPTVDNRYFDRLHHTSAELSPILVGLHIALDWRWVVSNTKKYLLRPFRRNVKESES